MKNRSYQDSVHFYGRIWVATGIFMMLLVPSLASSVGVLVPVGAAVAIGAARLMYKKNLL